MTIKNRILLTLVGGCLLGVALLAQTAPQKSDPNPARGRKLEPAPLGVPKLGYPHCGGTIANTGISFTFKWDAVPGADAYEVSFVHEIAPGVWSDPVIAEAASDIYRRPEGLSGGNFKWTARALQKSASPRRVGPWAALCAFHYDKPTLAVAQALQPACGSSLQGPLRECLIRWTPVKGAEAYEVLVDRLQPGGVWWSEVLRRTVTAESCSVQLGEGEYNWRVRGVRPSSPNPQVGPWSVRCNFQILAAKN